AKDGVGREVRAVGHALHGGKAAKRLTDRIGARTTEQAIVAAVFGKTVACDMRNHQFRIGRESHFVSRAVLSNVRYAVDPDIALFDQILKHGFRFRVAIEVCVEFEAVHVAAQADPLRNDSGISHALTYARGVTRAGNLDL